MLLWVSPFYLLLWIFWVLTYIRSSLKKKKKKNACVKLFKYLLFESKTYELWSLWKEKEKWLLYEFLYTVLDWAFLFPSFFFSLPFSFLLNSYVNNFRFLFTPPYQYVLCSVFQHFLSMENCKVGLFQRLPILFILFLWLQVNNFREEIIKDDIVSMVWRILRSFFLAGKKEWLSWELESREYVFGGMVDISFLFGFCGRILQWDFGFIDSSMVKIHCVFSMSSASSVVHG